MTLISFDIYSKLENSPFNYQIHLLIRLLYDLGLKPRGVPILENTLKLLDLIIPRIPIPFSLEFPITDSHYTEFAIWSAKRVAKQVR